VNVPLVLAGSLAILGTAIHGVAGEVLVVRRLTPQMLPPCPFGGPAATKVMIRASWHMTTIAFLTFGSTLLLSGVALHGDAARGISIVAASATTGFAALAVGGALVRGPRALIRHPAPFLLTTVAVLAWWGSSLK
jgi:hypothetical protein